MVNFNLKCYLFCYICWSLFS